jgi:hypothetical protein
MQVNGAGQGEVTIPRRRQLIVLLAILAAAATVVLLVWAALLATSEVGTQDATPKAAGAGSAVYYPLPHGKADNVYYPLPHGKADNSNAAGGGSAVLHDDAGNVNR